MEPGILKIIERQLKVAAFLCWLFLYAIGIKELSAQTGPPHKDTTLLEAIQSTLGNHPFLRIQQAQVEISRGRLDQATAAFDTTTQSFLNEDRLALPLTSGQKEQNATLGILNDSQTINATTYQFSLAKQFRNGIRLTPSYQLGRNTDDLFNTSGVNNSTVNLVVSVPLLRGRGRKVTDADEEAAKHEVDATSLDLDQLMSQLLLSTAASYWNLVAADKNLAIASSAEERGNAYLDHVNALVKADHAPPSDLNEATANLAQRTSNRISAEQQCVVARQQLALDMGLSADQMLSNPPAAIDDLPQVEGAPLPSISTSALQYYQDQALQRRADYLASQGRDRESKILLNAATNRLHSQLDLNLGIGYSGLKEGRHLGNFFSPTYTGVPGPSASIGIIYNFSGANHAARGAFREASAVSRQSELQIQQAARNISQQVVVAVEGVRNAILRVNQAHTSVEKFEAALDGEREKYRSGIGSILDILTVEDRLNNALSDQVQARLEYALALVQFRFATGTLIDPRTQVQQIPAGMFLTLPFADAPESRP